MTFEASRTKQVLILQPKGKPLYEDGKSSFGLKMLEKMGWNKGNGLGKNQQGNLDFIQVRYKNNAGGLGFDRMKDNQWTDTEHNFNELLQNLNSNSNDEDSNEGTKASVRTSKKSLEETSKQSRARVHYKKFTRGKDVHKYSEKDLANIFGKKSLDETMQTVVVEPVEEERPEPAYCESDMIINTGISITDYFKKKRNKESAEVPSDEKSSDEVKPKKKKSKSQEVTSVEEVHIKKKKKGSDRGDQEILEDDLKVEEKPKKKKRKASEEEPLEVTESEVQKDDEKPKKKKQKISEDPPEIATELDDKPKEKKKSDEASDVPQETPVEITENPKKKKKSDEVKVKEPEQPKGANAIYSTDVIQIPTHVAHKISKLTIDQFSSANLGNVVGYGMSQDIEIKVIQTKLGDTSLSTDKYSIYSMSKVVKTRVNPRKILRKISRTKKSIQVI